MKEIRQAYYFSIKKGLENLIAATPAGKERNLLTQANLFLFAAERELNGLPNPYVNDEGNPCWPKE